MKCPCPYCERRGKHDVTANMKILIPFDQSHLVDELLALRKLAKAACNLRELHDEEMRVFPVELEAFDQARAEYEQHNLNVNKGETT